MFLSNRHNLVVCAQALLLSLLLPAIAFSMSSSGAGLPVEESFDVVKDSVVYVGGVLLVVGIVITGVKMATGDGGGIGGKTVGLIMGGMLILASDTIVETVFAGTNGLLL